jgi:hypothetical protein
VPAGGFPVYSVIYRGARVYDPRDPGQTFFDDDFDLYDETWKFSENPALAFGPPASVLLPLPDKRRISPKRKTE